jgi:uncharacterized protein (TIGR03546 family)
MLLLAWIRKIYKVLSADASPSAIAFAAAFGLTLGCVPVTSGAFLCLLLLLLVFRVQVSAGILFWVIGRAMTLVFAKVAFYPIGDSLLYNESLMGFWTWLLNAPVFAWSGFAYPAVLGGFVFGAGIGAALFVPIRLLVIAYRRWAHEKVSKNEFFKWMTNFWFIKALKWVFVGGTP